MGKIKEDNDDFSMYEIYVGLDEDLNTFEVENEGKIELFYNGNYQYCQRQL